MKTVGVFFHLKGSSIKRDKATCGPWKMSSKPRTWPGFSVIVISSLTPGRARVHLGMGDSDLAALFHSKTLSFVSSFTLLPGYEFRQFHTFCKWKANGEEKGRMGKGSSVCVCVYLRCSLYLLGDAASIYASPSSRAIRLHKCCWGICWLSDSDQYVCYQVQGGRVCAGQGLNERQRYLPRKNNIPAAVIYAGYNSFWFCCFVLFFFYVFQLFYWFVKISAVNLSGGSQLSLMYPRKRLTAIALQAG